MPQLESLYSFLSQRVSISELSSIVLLLLLPPHLQIMQLQADSDINTQPNFPGLISILNQLLINRNTAFLSQLPSLLDDFTNQLTELIEAIGYNVSSQLCNVLNELRIVLDDCSDLKPSEAVGFPRFPHSRAATW